ncbi:hypothetical protein TNCV_2243601 [Trichonephila clavipes]|nr:hypothetical protein TNCV_2243601 [Trichonephila clavipes]
MGLELHKNDICGLVEEHGQELVTKDLVDLKMKYYLWFLLSSLLELHKNDICGLVEEHSQELATKDLVD